MLTPIYKHNRFNFEDLNVSSNLDTKYQSAFYASAFKKSNNFILTDENTLALRKGTYYFGQQFFSTFGTLGSNHQRLILDLNTIIVDGSTITDDYCYCVVANDRLYRFKGDLTYNTGDVESTYLLGEVDGIDYTNRPLGYSFYGKSRLVLPNVFYIDTKSCLVLTYTNKTCILENNTSSNMAFPFTPVEVTELSNPSSLFFEDRLVLGGDQKVKFSGGIYYSSYAKSNYIILNTNLVWGNNPVYTYATGIKLNTDTIGQEVDIDDAYYFNGFELSIKYRATGDVGDRLVTISVPSTGANWNNTTKELNFGSTAFYVGGWYQIFVYFLDLQKDLELTTHFTNFGSFLTRAHDPFEFEFSDLKASGGSIMWIEKYKDVIAVGTTLGLYFMTSSDGGVITATNINIKKVNDIVLSSIKPVIINNVLYALDNNYNMISFVFDWQSENIKGTYLDVLIKEIAGLDFKHNPPIKMIAINLNSIAICINRDENIVNSSSPILYVYNIKENKIVSEKHSIEGITEIQDIIFKNKQVLITNFADDEDLLDNYTDDMNLLMLVQRRVGLFYYYNVYGLDYGYDYLKEKEDFDTEAEYLAYLNDYQLKFPSKDSMQVSSHVLAGEDYIGELKSTDIENIEDINGYKKVFKLYMYLYNSGNFSYKLGADEVYQDIDLTKDGQIANTLPALYTGRYEVDYTSSGVKNIYNLYIQTKANTPFHLTGVQLLIQEETQK